MIYHNPVTKSKKDVSMWYLFFVEKYSSNEVTHLLKNIVNDLIFLQITRSNTIFLFTIYNPTK